MRHYNYLWLLVIIFISTTCTKEEPTSGPTKVEGIVKDAVSMNAVPNADVYLTRTRKGDVGAMSTQGVGHTKADDNGRFTFDFNAEEDYYYEICAKKKYYNENGQCTYVNGGKANKNFEVKIQPYSWIKFYIINEPPKDYIEVFAMSDNDVPNLYNFNGDTIFLSKRLAGQRASYWSITKNGRELKDSLIFSLSPLDTVAYTIKY